MKKLKLVMVGNGMAGMRTLEELLKLAPDLYDITVFGAEPHGNYNRILLSPVLAGEMTIKDIMLNDVDWYAQNGITLHLGKKIAQIDRVRRKVIAADGTTSGSESIRGLPPRSRDSDDSALPLPMFTTSRRVSSATASAPPIDSNAVMPPASRVTPSAGRE